MITTGLLLIVLAVLVVVVLALCGVLASQLGVPWTWVASPAVVAIVVGSMIGLLLKVQVARRVQRRNDEAVALLHQGQVERAARALDDLMRASKRFGALHALVQQNRAVASLYEGDLTRALDVLTALDRAGWYERQLVTVKVHALGAIVLALALSGRYDEAQRVLQERRVTLSAAQQPLLVLPEAVVLCLRGDLDGALAAIDRDRAAFEGLATGRATRVLGLLRSFATQREEELGEAERRSVVDAADAARHIIRHWAALRRFVEAAQRTEHDAANSSTSSH